MGETNPKNGEGFLLVVRGRWVFCDAHTLRSMDMEVRREFLTLRPRPSGGRLIRSFYGGGWGATERGNEALPTNESAYV
jgi:hypothetical protein